LVDFWATWCAPCKASFPLYAELYERYREHGFEVVAISVDRHDDTVRSFLERWPVPFRVLWDAEATVADQFGVTAMPTAVLLGRDGEILWVHAGFEADDEAHLRTLISTHVFAKVGEEAERAAPPEAAQP
jgi:thiol-disulfide isomerase/thioredoxin